VVESAGTALHATVMSGFTTKVGNAAGLTVIVLVTGVKTLPQASVALHVSVMVPPHPPAGTCAEKVDAVEVPLIRHPPGNPLE
jgi:hypothetical protein